MADRGRLAVEVAPFWRRLLADLLDLCALSAVTFALWQSGLIVPAGLPERRFGWLDHIADLVGERAALFQPALVVVATAALLYGLMTRLLLGGGTPGERLLGLRLMGPDGRAPGPLRALLHAAGTALGLALLGLG
ncbi:MAG: RDD family protein, partial [Myxococcales bacterium]|nr:RDD family protein [Myxococcales bacterium]